MDLNLKEKVSYLSKFIVSFCCFICGLVLQFVFKGTVILMQESSSPEELIDNKKFCTDCKTTKTPLWRGGPAGPKVIPTLLLLLHYLLIFASITFSSSLGFCGYYFWGWGNLLDFGLSFLNSIAQLTNMGHCCTMPCFPLSFIIFIVFYL